jgi:hypothetical protein
MLLAVLSLACLGAQGGAAAQPSDALIQLSSTSLLIGVLTIIGVQVVVVLGGARSLRRISREWNRDDITQLLLDDDSPFGKHRRDPNAHEQMRKAMMLELKECFEKIEAQMTNADRAHREEMQNFTTLMRPIIEQNGKLIEQNGRAVEIMSAQMRRGVQEQKESER